MNRWTIMAIAAALTACAALASAEDSVMFRYDGVVENGAGAFTGKGHFKFALLNTSATATLWTNDGTGMEGSQPAAGVEADVVGGVFTIMIGDPALSMSAMSSALFTSPTPLKLRTWFNDGTSGYELLHPDRTLVNITLVALSSGPTDFTIYVNAATGNDANSGFAPDKAKKTIRGAVAILPMRLNCNVTVDIAAGDYREDVRIGEIRIMPGKTLTFLGDRTWTASSAGSPVVRIPGTATDESTASKVREYGLCATQCSGVAVKGVFFDRQAVSGLMLDNGDYWVENCKFSQCGNNGLLATANCHATVTGCLSESNAGAGFSAENNSHAIMKNSIGRLNQNGFQARNGSIVNFDGSGQYNNNTKNGISIAHVSSAVFWNVYSGQANDNGEYGVYIAFRSYIENDSRTQRTGNGLGGIETAYGGMRTY